MLMEEEEELQGNLMRSIAGIGLIDMRRSTSLIDARKDPLCDRNKFNICRQRILLYNTFTAEENVAAAALINACGSIRFEDFKRTFEYVVHTWPFSRDAHC